MAAAVDEMRFAKDDPDRFFFEALSLWRAAGHLLRKRAALMFS